MGRDTPIFSCLCIPTPFLPWAKNTRAGWTGKIIMIKELSRPCVQPLPWLSPLPFDQDRFLTHGLPLPPWMTYLFIPIPHFLYPHILSLHIAPFLIPAPCSLSAPWMHPPSLDDPLSHATQTLGTYSLLLRPPSSSFPQSTFPHLLTQFISKRLFAPRVSPVSCSSPPSPVHPPSPLHPSYPHHLPLSLLTPATSIPAPSSLHGL